MNRSKNVRKFCFKCGKDYDESFMRPKIDNRGRRIGSQCVFCIEKKSKSMIQKNAPSVEGAGVFTTESHKKIQ